MPDRECAICGVMFTPQRSTGKTCSLDCSVQLRRRRSREIVARKYQPRPLRPDTACEACGVSIPAPKTGRMPRWCPQCRRDREDVRARKRTAVRRCYKCKVPLPDAARKPGVAVCDGCRAERPRDRQKHEQWRRLRKYGLTQDDYDELLQVQGGRCAACGTDKPGIKGWAIDHCHRSGEVRALLCMRCNTTAGLVNEDPAVLRALADWLERQTAQVG